VAQLFLLAMFSSWGWWNKGDHRAIRLTSACHVDETLTDGKMLVEMVDEEHYEQEHYERTDDPPWALSRTSEDGKDKNIATFRANCMAPCIISYTVPQDSKPGDPITVQGPHGPLVMVIPQDSKPGVTVKVPIGPVDAQTLTVPEGLSPGDKMRFTNEKGEEVETTVPEDLKPGDIFSVAPPVMMVQVPECARSGDRVVFTTPGDTQHVVMLPEHASPGQYFSVII